MGEKVSKTEKAYEKVIAYIKDAIWRGSLKRGDPLPPERELAQQLGVSRNSVREAMRTMSLMGFISSIQGAGNFVSCDLEKNLSQSLELMFLLGETNYLQISQLRCGLESETARLAAQHVLPRQAARLAELARQMAEENDVTQAARLDQQFHFMLCQAAGNRLILALFGAMLTTVNRFIGTMYVEIVQDPGQAQKLHAAHEQIAQALLERDAERAVQAMREHFEIVDRSISKM